MSYAYYNLGNLYHNVDQVNRAETAFRRSLEIIEPLAASNANSPVFAEQLLLSLDGLGRLLSQKKADTIEAEKLFVRALEAGRKYSPADPESALNYPRALTLWNLGILYTQMQQAEKAIPLLEQARDLLIKLTNRTPAKQQQVNSLAGCLNSLGVAFRMSGRAGDAEKTYQESVKLRKELATKNPSVTAFQGNWAISIYNLGNLYFRGGRLALAEQTYKQAQEIQEKLVAEFPALARVKRDLSETYFKMASLFTSMGRRDEGERMHYKILTLREQLCKDYPDTIEFHELLGLSYGAVADFYRDAKQFAEAEVNYRKKIAIYKRLIEKNPRNPGYESDLGLAYNNLGRIYRPMSRYKDAEVAYGEALSIQEKLARENPKLPDFRVDVATTQNNLGNLYAELNQREKAEDYFRKSIRGHEALVREYPETAYYRQELARSYNGLGTVFLATARLKEAEPLFRKSAEQYRKIVEKEPGNLSYHIAQVHSLLNLSEMLNHTRRHSEAEALCKEMLPLLERRARQYPKYVELARLLGSAQRQMGQALSESGLNSGEAIRWYSRAIVTLNEVARKAPGIIEIRKVLLESYSERSKLYLELSRNAAAHRDLDQAIALSSNPGLLLTLARRSAKTLAADHTRSTAQADKLASQPNASGFLAYSAACVYAQSSVSVREDGRLSSSEKDKLAEHYAKRALEWLRKAQASGFFKDASALEGLKIESDLTPLRNRDSYKKWFSEL
jgi:tetratricopeptide (TPR) repeat protein